MNYIQFRKQFYDLGCFAAHQVYAWQPSFDKNNLTRWTKADLLVKLRNGWYAFPEYLAERDFAYYISNRIYRPSYISLHTALAFYGMIPEGVVQVTAVSGLKKATFVNSFGTFTYQKLSPQMMFGYEARPLADGRSLLMATPEKALIDLLYLYPFYDSAQECGELRLDDDFMHNNFDLASFRDYAFAIQSKALTKRTEILINNYF